MIGMNSKNKKEEEISKKTEEENKNVTPRENSRRDKPICDRAPDFGAPSNVRPPKNRRLIKGTFKNIECPGTMLSFHFRYYKEPIKQYHLMDGQTYDLFIEVINHLNDDCCYKEHKWKVGGDNKIISMDGSDPGENKEVARATSRFAFIPLASAFDGPISE